MLDVYVIEIANQTAGIIVREPNRAEFKFFSATRNFDALEGLAFSDANRAEQAALHLMRFGNLPRGVGREKPSA